MNKALTQRSPGTADHSVGREEKGIRMRTAVVTIWIGALIATVLTLATVPERSAMGLALDGMTPAVVDQALRDDPRQQAAWR